MRTFSILLCGLLAVTTGAAPAVTETTFRDAAGAERAATIVAPPEGTPVRGGILFLHWLGGPPKNDRTEFLDDAQTLAQHGITSFLIDLPWAERGWFRNRDVANDPAMSAAVTRSVTMAVDRLETLLPRGSKIALVGHDFGAMYGLIAAGNDKRIGAAVLIAATPRFADWFLLGRELDEETKRVYLEKIRSLDAPQHLARRAGMPLLFQFSRKDDYIPLERANELFAAASEPKEIRWYDSTHRMDHPDAARDRIAWVAKWFGISVPAPLSVEDELRAVELRWDNALVAADKATLDEVLAPEFIYTSPAGALTTKQQILENIGKPGPRQMKSNRTTDVEFILLGDSAVVTGRYIEEGIFTGKPYQIETRYTDVYTRRNGKWVAIAAHASGQKITLDGKLQEPAK
jgi:fermentation-respiration switch protein FrsA (DUF1100 family)/ketosteroid isomerase-like protein